MTFLVESDCANRIRERLVSPQRFSLIKPFFSLGCPEGIFLFFRGRATRSWKKTNSRSQPKDFTGEEPTSSLSNHRPMSDSAICHQLRRDHTFRIADNPTENASKAAWIPFWPSRSSYFHLPLYCALRISKTHGLRFFSRRWICDSRGRMILFIS